jgi:hypothetical protein
MGGRACFFMAEPIQKDQDAIRKTRRISYGLAFTLLWHDSMASSNRYLRISSKSQQGLGVCIGTFGAQDRITVRESSGNVGVGTTNPKSNFEVNGSVGYKVKMASVDYTLLPDDNIILLQTPTGPYFSTIRLPSAASAKWRVYTIKACYTMNYSSIDIIAQPNEKIENSQKLGIMCGSPVASGLKAPSQYASCQIVSDGTSWWMLSTTGTNFYYYWQSHGCLG